MSKAEVLIAFKLRCECGKKGAFEPNIGSETTVTCVCGRVYDIRFNITVKSKNIKNKK